MASAATIGGTLASVTTLLAYTAASCSTRFGSVANDVDGSVAAPLSTAPRRPLPFCEIPGLSVSVYLLHACCLSCLSACLPACLSCLFVGLSAGLSILSVGLPVSLSFLCPFVSLSLFACTVRRFRAVHMPPSGVPFPSGGGGNRLPPTRPGDSFSTFSSPSPPGGTLARGRTRGS